MTDDPILPLVEKFHSVQGEGWNTGREALFIRFAGCNLDCVFADGSVCDTPWERPQEKILLSEVLVWVDDHVPDGPGDDPEEWIMVVLTGGEPTIAPAFDLLVRRLRERRVYVAVETNGTRWRQSLDLVHHVAVSPKDIPGIQHGHKLPNREIKNTHVDPRVWALPPHEYRFVITSRDEPVPPYYPAQRGHYLSPAFEADGTGQEHLSGNEVRPVTGAAERCFEIVTQDPRPWRISLQTHKFLRVR